MRLADLRLAVRPERDVGDEDAEDRDAALVCHRRAQAASGGITPFLKTKQP